MQGCCGPCTCNLRVARYSSCSGTPSPPPLPCFSVSWSRRQTLKLISRSAAVHGLQLMQFPLLSSIYQQLSSGPIGKPFKASEQILRIQKQSNFPIQSSCKFLQPTDCVCILGLEYGNINNSRAPNPVAWQSTTKGPKKGGACCSWSKVTVTK